MQPPTVKISDAIERLKEKGLVTKVNFSGSLPTASFKLSTDSRNASRSSIFIAIKGSTVDGHDYISDLAQKTNSWIISEKDYPGVDNLIVVKSSRRALAHLAALAYGDPQAQMKAVGITGTNGKTSVASIIYKALFESGKSAAIIGTLGAEWVDRDGNTHQIETGFTTPFPLQLCELLGRLRADGVDHLVMEVSSHALDQARVDMIHFDVSIFTGISQDHLDYHPNFEAYLSAKIKLFIELTKGSSVIFQPSNLNESVVDKIKEERKDINSSFATAKLPVIEITNQSINKIEESGYKETHRYSLKSPSGNSYNFQPQLRGPFAKLNYLLSIEALERLGIQKEGILRGIESIQTIPGRNEVIVSGRGFEVWVDYAHTPQAIEDISSYAKSLGQGRVIIVFGCGGNRDRSKREKMAEAASKYSDIAILTSDNPRQEAPSQIFSDAQKGLSEKDQTIEDRREAIRIALSEAKKNDLVLVLGRGHEKHQLFADGPIEFHDPTVVKELLKN